MNIYIFNIKIIKKQVRYTLYMNKKLLLLFAAIFGGIGGYIPVLFGDNEFDGWSILGGLIGGLFGIWLGIVVAKRWG